MPQSPNTSHTTGRTMSRFAEANWSRLCSTPITIRAAKITQTQVGMWLRRALVPRVVCMVLAFKAGGDERIVVRRAGGHHGVATKRRNGA